MFSRFILKNAGKIVLSGIFLSVFGIFSASKLRLESNLAELLPEKFNSVKTLNKIKGEIGGVSNLRLILESHDYDQMLNFANVLVDSLSSKSVISYIDYKNDVSFYEKNGLLLIGKDELDSLKDAIVSEVNSKKQKINPLFVDDLFGNDNSTTTQLLSWEKKYKDNEIKEYFINADSTVLVIKILPSEASTSLNFIVNLLETVEKTITDFNIEAFYPGLKIYLGGALKNKVDEYYVIRKDILGTALYGLGGVFLVIAIYFRKLSSAFLITIALSCSLSWTFGLAYFVLGNLNTITGFLFVILFGLGIDYGIHAFSRYSESRRKGFNVDDSIEKMVLRTGKALTVAALTTSLAFFSLMLMDFKGFSELGFISATGILFALVAMLTLLPAMIVLGERRGWLSFKTVSNRSSKKLQKFPYTGLILLFSSVISIVSLYALFKVSFEYDFTNLRAITKERRLIDQKTKGVFKLSESPAVILADTKDEVSEIVDAIKQIIEGDTLTPTVEAVRSVYSLVPEDQNAKLQKINEIRDYINTEAIDVLTGEEKFILDKFQSYLQVEQPFTWADFPEKDKRQFITKDGEIGNFVFIYPSVALRDGRNAIDFRDDIGTITTDSRKTYHASSSNIIMADMLTVLTSEGLWAVVLTFVVVFLIILLDFRNLMPALLVLSPLVFGVIWTVGLMYLFGLKWNLFNIVVIPSIIGIGVDHGVHIYHRYLEEGNGSLAYVLKNTGLAVAMTTLTTMIGYSGLVFAHHPGLNSIGVLALIGISLTFLTSVLVLPAMIQFLENRGIIK